ncbi:MAG: hypothetical protein JETT_2645 [Candidatus Jettenia ecosi]|uniref:Uncharacterized protein n=1 Tax=Candidatus Jettenia ecosi TaxID=2494326 RepID=A0A533Q8R8_9BACT|nr:MAG: hypothetical protein JETT_2645 [Candidatus Jettenia ecosi]
MNTKEGKRKNDLIITHRRKHWNLGSSLSINKYTDFFRYNLFLYILSALCGEKYCLG